MAFTLNDLDGKYQVATETSSGGPQTVKGDGTTEIRDGLTYRKDSNGFIWESSFSILGDTQVQMESTVDPSHAPSGAFIKDEKGNLTKGMMTYKTILELSTEGGKTKLSGTISHGGETTKLVMIKIS